MWAWVWTWVWVWAWRGRGRGRGCAMVSIILKLCPWPPHVVLQGVHYPAYAIHSDHSGNRELESLSRWPAPCTRWPWFALCV